MDKEGAWEISLHIPEKARGGGQLAQPRLRPSEEALTSVPGQEDRPLGLDSSSSMVLHQL